MANTYKNIVITPNIGNTSDPRVQFSGGNTSANTDINLYVYPTSNGTLSFEGSAGQLFSITNDLSNSLFAVSDVSGIPSIEVYANSLVTLAPFGGNVNIDAGTFFVDGVNARVGINNTSPSVALQVTGTMNVSTNTLNLGASTNAATGYTILPNLIKMNWGVVVPNSIGSNTATFSSPFTTNAYTVSLSIRASVANVGAANASSATFSVVNNSTIIINVANNTVGVNTGVLGVHYLAIGPV